MAIFSLSACWVCAAEHQYWVNLAGVADPDAAEAVRRRAAAALPDRFVIQPVDAEEGRVYRVVCGPYLRESLARQLLSDARRAGFAEAWLSGSPVDSAGQIGASGAVSGDEQSAQGVDPAIYDQAGADTFVDRAPPDHQLHRLRREADGGG
jgi:hypothetical protein